MTAANDEVPEPPRHCMEEMDLVTAGRVTRTSIHRLWTTLWESHTPVTRRQPPRDASGSAQRYCVAVMMPARMSTRPTSSHQFEVPSGRNPGGQQLDVVEDDDQASPRPSRANMRTGTHIGLTFSSLGTGGV